MKKQKTVLIIVDRFYPYLGGAETLFLQKANYYYEEGYHVIVLTSGFDSKLAHNEVHSWGEIIRIGRSRLSFTLQSFFKARGYITTYDIQIIHTSSNYSMWSVWLLHFFTKAKTIITVHEIYGGLWIKLFGRWRGIRKLLAEKLSLAITGFDEYQCVSLYTLNSLRLMTLIPDHKLKLVRNSIDKAFRTKDACIIKNQQDLQKTYKITRQTAEQVGKKVGLFFGRLGYIKGLDMILKALPEIVEKNPNFKLVIISPHDEKLQQLVAPGFHDYVIRIEEVSQEELRDRIGLSDVCILPSKAEGFGYAIAEAASMEANIITTRIGAIPEVLEGYKKAYYLNSCDSSELINALDLYLK